MIFTGTTFGSLFTLLWSVAFITSNNGTDGKYNIGLNMYDRRTPFLYSESWQQMLWSLDEVKTLWKWDTKKFPRLLAALREEILTREGDGTVFTLPGSRCPLMLVSNSGLILTLRGDADSGWVTGLGVQGVCSTISFPSPCILFYFILSNTLFWVAITDLNREFYL